MTDRDEMEKLFAVAFENAPNKDKHALAKAINRCLQILYPSVNFDKRND